VSRTSNWFCQSILLVACAYRGIVLRLGLFVCLFISLFLNTAPLYGFAPSSESVFKLLELRLESLVGFGPFSQSVSSCWN